MKLIQVAPTAVFRLSEVRPSGMPSPRVQGHPFVQGLRLDRLASDA